MAVAPNAPERSSAPAHHAFAPVAQTQEAEEACGEARVRFGAGSASLDARAREQLHAYATCVTEDGPQALYISGTSDAGAGASNMDLAAARARAVADYLHQDGLRMDFEVHTYRAGSMLPQSTERHAGRSATVTTVSPYRGVAHKSR